MMTADLHTDLSDRYQEISVIGNGAYGTVYKGRSLKVYEVVHQTFPKYPRKLTLIMIIV